MTREQALEKTLRELLADIRARSAYNPQASDECHQFISVSMQKMHAAEQALTLPLDVTPEEAASALQEFAHSCWGSEDNQDRCERAGTRVSPAPGSTTFWCADHAHPTAVKQPWERVMQWLEKVAG